MKPKRQRPSALAAVTGYPIMTQLQRIANLNSISDADLVLQTKIQHNAVNHMAVALATTHAQLCQIMGNGKMERALVEINCERSARIMEMLGDALNEMGAHDDKEDAWLKPVFAKAHATMG